MGKAAVSSREIRQIVGDVDNQYLALPPEWTPEQSATFTEDEAATISPQIAQLADQMGAQSVAEWTQRTGVHPDYLTKVGLLNTAMASAREIVLSNELYELIPEPQDPPTVTTETPPRLPRLDRSQVPWDQRWTRTQYRSDPSDQIEGGAVARLPAVGLPAAVRDTANLLDVHVDQLAGACPLVADGGRFGGANDRARQRIALTQIRHFVATQDR